METDRRGELCEFGQKTQAEAIRDSLHRTHNGKFGFTIYRVAYGNDESFARFLELLTAHVNVELDEDDTGVEIKHLLEWDVRDNQSELDGASINQVREHFNVWVESVDGSRALSMYAHCIYADAESINAVLAGEQANATTTESILNPTAFVKVIFGRWTDTVEQLGPDAIEDDELRRKHNEGDEGYDPI